ncbi:MAG: hypothetical protein NVS4B3_18960 [Gemmatimonadaceae bacterium]
MTRQLLALILAATAFASRVASAQTTANGTATLTVGTILYISATNTSPTFTPTATDFNAGSVLGSAASSVVSKGNVTHTVNLASSATAFTPSGAGARPAKPSTDLQVQITPSGGTAGAWTGLSTTNTVVALSRAAGDYTASAVSCAYRTLLSYALDTPGTYTLAITYTVVAG